MIAALNANGRGVRMLLEAGTDVRARDRSGKAPLMYAVTWQSRIGGEPPAASRDCHLRILRALLSAGADPEARDHDGKSARDHAIEKHDTEALKVLPEYTAHPYPLRLLLPPPVSFLSPLSFLLSPFFPSLPPPPPLPLGPR
jgi:hypothetical protein